MVTIDNNQDILNSNDIDEYIGWLKEDIKALETCEDKDLGEYEDLLSELKVLEDLVESCRYYSSWENGVVLIHDDHFVEYAEDVAVVLGLIHDLYSWPATHINWDKAAEHLQMDYNSVDFNGVKYWIREN